MKHKDFAYSKDKPPVKKKDAHKRFRKDDCFTDGEDDLLYNWRALGGIVDWRKKWI